MLATSAIPQQAVRLFWVCPLPCTWREPVSWQDLRSAQDTTLISISSLQLSPAAVVAFGLMVVSAAMAYSYSAILPSWIERTGQVALTYPIVDERGLVIGYLT